MSSSRSFFSLAASAMALVLFGAGCAGLSQPAPSTDGGVWKTSDRGQTWVNKRALVSGAKATAAAAGFAIVDMVMDPQDNQAIYLATVQNGLAYSYDGGDSWQQYKVLNAGKINGVAVDPKNKCTIFAVGSNKIFKTDNCGRDWNPVYFDARVTKAMTRVAVDWYNSTIVYAGTSDGDILKSNDAGASWQVVHRVEATGISSIVVDNRDSRIVYAGTLGEGIWKTADAGATWTNIKKQFGNDFSDARRVAQLVMDPKNPNTLYLVSRYGIIRSDDQGETWKAINLTAPPGSIKITAMTVDPTNTNRLTYVTASAIGFSSDAGATWTVKKLPTSQGGSALLSDPQNAGMIYLGTQPLPKN